jgi:hypothetical protein
MNVRQSDCYYFFLSQLSSAAIRNCLLLWYAGPIPKTFPFMDSVVLVDFERPEECHSGGRVIVPLKSLFSKFEFVPVTFSNINDVIDPLVLSGKKVTSVYKKDCSCGNNYRHYSLDRDVKILYKDSMEVLCNKLTEIAEEIRKQL